MLDHRDRIVDVLGELANSLATLVAADAIAVIRSTAIAAGAGLIDTGGGFTEGNLVIDLSANTEGWKTGCTAGPGATSSDQKMAFVLQGSTTSTFATQSPLAVIPFGVPSVNPATPFHIQPAFLAWGAATADMAPARAFIRPFNNTYGHKVYRWLRLYLAFAGTWGTGLNFRAYLTKWT